MGIFIWSLNPIWVSDYFSFGLFQYLALGLRSIYGPIHYTVGEYVYIFLISILIIKLIQILFKLKNKIKKENLRSISIYFFKKLLYSIIKIYVVFMLIWGMNYRKVSIAGKFNLKLDSMYTEQQLDSLSLDLISQLNIYRQNIPDSILKKLNYAAVFDQCLYELAGVQKTYEFVKLQKPVLKKAIFPTGGDYLGYTAFYQPLTGEAIIRTDVPVLTLPFTCLHELAHQMGYASEAEANFMAFVIASESKNPIFKYSMLLQIFTYCQAEHLSLVAKSGNFENWKNKINRNKALLDPKVYADRKQIKDFFNQRQHLLIPASSSLYDQFLQWNKQAKGIRSYDEVLLWVLAYKEKHEKPYFH